MKTCLRINAVMLLRWRFESLASRSVVIRVEGIQARHGAIKAGFGQIVVNWALGNARLWIEIGVSGCLGLSFPSGRIHNIWGHIGSWSICRNLGETLISSSFISEIFIILFHISLSNHQTLLSPDHLPWNNYYLFYIPTMHQVSLSKIFLQSATKLLVLEIAPSFFWIFNFPMFYKNIPITLQDKIYFVFFIKPNNYKKFKHPFIIINWETWKITCLICWRWFNCVPFSIYTNRIYIFCTWRCMLYFWQSRCLFVDFQSIKLTNLTYYNYLF